MQKHDLVKSHNFFGHPVYSPFAALTGGAGDPLIKFLDERLGETLALFGVSLSDIIRAAEEVIGRNGRDPFRGARHLGFERRFILDNLEDHLRDSLRAKLFPPRDQPDSLVHAAEHSVAAEDRLATGVARKDSRSEGLTTRSQRIAGQVEAVLVAHLPAPKSRLALLDVGCGDGSAVDALLTLLAIREVTVDAVLVDIASYLAAAAQSYTFVKLPPDYEQFVLEQRAPGFEKDKKFDLILVLTVLHHSEVPSRVFRACAEVAGEGALIVVIESCVGIEPKHLQLERLDPQGASCHKAGAAYARLGLDEQLRYAAFADWFYNRVIQVTNDVYVPCNFGSPEEWNALFSEFGDFEVIASFIEGFDQPLAPEFHTVHVVKRVGRVGPT